MMSTFLKIVICLFALFVIVESDWPLESDWTLDFDDPMPRKKSRRNISKHNKTKINKKKRTQKIDENLFYVSNLYLTRNNEETPVFECRECINKPISYCCGNCCPGCSECYW